MSVLPDLGFESLHGILKRISRSAETGDRTLDAQKIFKLANSAYSLYVSQNSVEKAKLLKLVVSNFSVDAVSVTPTYRQPFDIIAKRAQSEEWSGRTDSNPDPRLQGRRHYPSSHRYDLFQEITQKLSPGSETKSIRTQIGFFGRTQSPSMAKLRKHA